MANINVSGIEIESNIFTNNKSIVSVDCNNTSFVNNSMTNSFFNCSKLNGITNINNNISEMFRTFWNCTNLTGDILIGSENITNALGCFYGTSLTKNVYIPFQNNGVNTITYNTFIESGYDEMGSREGVYLKDLNSIPPEPPITKTYIIQGGAYREKTHYLISSNGIDYELKTLQNYGGGPASNGGTCYYANNRYYLKSDTALLTTLTPYDADSWVKCVADRNNTMRCITYGNDIYIGQVGKSLYTSTDGINFVEHANTFSIDNGYYSSCVYAAGIFVIAIGYDSSSGSGAIYTSTNGLNWTKRKSFSGRTNIKNGGLIYDGSRFILLCSQGLYTSSNGTSWTSASKPASGAGQIAYCNGIYLITLGNLTYYSSDLSNWTKTTTTKSYPFISSDGEKFFRTYFQDSNILETSTDGQNWETHTLPYTSYYIEVNGDIKI